MFLELAVFSLGNSMTQMAHIGRCVKGVSGNLKGYSLIFEYGFHEHIDCYRSIQTSGAAELIECVFVCAIQTYT